VYNVKVGQGAWDQTQPVPQPPAKGVPEGGTGVNKYTNYDKMWPLLLGSFGDQPAQKAVDTPFNYTTAPLASTGVPDGVNAKALWGGASPANTPNATPSTGGWMSPEWSTEYSQLACYPAYWNVAPQPQLLPLQPGGDKADPATFTDAGGLVMGGGNVFIGNGIGAYTGRSAYFDSESVQPTPPADPTQPNGYDNAKPPTLITLDKTGVGGKGTFFTYEGSETAASWSPSKPATAPPLTDLGAIGFPLDNLHQQYILLYRINQKIMEFNWKCAQQAEGKADYGIKPTWAKTGDPLVIPYIGHVHHDKESYQVNKTPLYPVCDATTGELSTAWLLGDDTGAANPADLVSKIRGYSPEAYLVWKQNRRLAGVSYEKYLFNRYMPAEFLPDWRVGGNAAGNPAHYLPHNSGCLVPCTGDRSLDGFSNKPGTGEALWDTKNKPWNIDQQRNFGTEPSSYSRDTSGDAPPLPAGAHPWTDACGVGNYTNDLRSRQLVFEQNAPSANKRDGIQRYPMGWVNYKVECWSHSVPFGQSNGPAGPHATGSSDSGSIFAVVEITSGSLASVAAGQLFVQENTLASGTVYGVSGAELQLCIKQGNPGSGDGGGGFNDEEKILVYTDPTKPSHDPATVTLTPKKNSIVTAKERYTSQGHNEAYQELYNIGEVKPPFADGYFYDASPKKDPKTGNKPPPSPTITLKTSAGDLTPYIDGTVTYSGTPSIQGTIVSVLDKVTLVLKEYVTYQASGKPVEPKDDLSGEGTFPDKAQVTLTTKDGSTTASAYIGDSYWPTTNTQFPPEFLMIKTPPAQGIKQEYGTTIRYSDISQVIFELPPPPKAGSGAANYIPNKFGSACVPGETPPVCPAGKSVFCPKYPTQSGSQPTDPQLPWSGNNAWNPTQFEGCANEKDSASDCYFNCPATACTPDCCAVGPYYKLNAVTNTLISRVYNKYTCDPEGNPTGSGGSDPDTRKAWRASFLGKNAVVTTGSSPALTDIWLRADTNAKGQAILPLDGRGTEADSTAQPIPGTDYNYPKWGNSVPLSPSKKSANDGVYAPLQGPYVDLNNSHISLTGMYGNNWPGMPTGDEASKTYYTIPVPDSPTGAFLAPQGPRQAIALFANEFIGGALTADPTARPGSKTSGWSAPSYGVFKPKDNENPGTDVWPQTGSSAQPPYLRKGKYGLVPGPVESWAGSRCMEAVVYGNLTLPTVPGPDGTAHPTVNKWWISPGWTGTGDPNKKDGTGASESPFTVDNWKDDITGKDPPAGKTAIGTLRENWVENGWSYDANSWGGEYNGLSSLQDKRDYAKSTTGHAPFTGYGLMKEFLAACASMQSGIRSNPAASDGEISPTSLHGARVGLYTIGFMPESWLKNGPF